jgi:hypothetical protein
LAIAVAAINCRVAQVVLATPNERKNNDLLQYLLDVRGLSHIVSLPGCMAKCLGNAEWIVARRLRGGQLKTETPTAFMVSWI